MATLTASYLKSRLQYDAITGVFTWKPIPAFTSQDRSWNTRFAGNVAGYVRADGYRTILIDGERYYGHRLAWLYETGSMPVDQLDHVNGNRDDNRIKNLREATPAQNMANVRPYGQTGLKGVVRNWGRFQANISEGGKLKHLGLFDTAEEAARAYDDAARRLRGCFARLNYP